MKLTKSKLQKIIQEELKAALDETDGTSEEATLTTELQGTALDLLTQALREIHGAPGGSDVLNSEVGPSYEYTIGDLIDNAIEKLA